MTRAAQQSLFPEVASSRDWHRVHAAPALGRGGCSFDVGPVRWRGEGGSQAAKREVAYRLSLCWNLAEGWSTEALQSGAFRDGDVLIQELLEAIRNHGAALPEEVLVLATSLADSRAQRDAHYDFSNRRPHDCPGCLRRDLED